MANWKLRLLSKIHSFISIKYSQYSKILYPITFFSIAALLVFHKLFFQMNGYFDFGNMLSIYDSKSYIESVFPLFNPYQNNGFIEIIPPMNIEFYIIAHILYYFSNAINAGFSVKVLVFFSVIMLSMSFYFFVSQLTNKIVARYISATFFTYGPFSLELFAQGDFWYFVFESFFILSVALLVQFYKTGGNRYYIFSGSLLLLFLSCGFNDIFYTGLVEFLIFGLFSIYVFSSKYHWNIFRQTLKFFAMYLFIIPISLPLIYGLLFPTFSLSPSSPLGLPLTVYLNNSIGIIKTLSLESYPPNIAWTSVHGTFGILFLPWQYTEFAIIIFSLIVGFIYLNGKAIIISILTITSDLIASGTKSPIGTILIWAYKNLPGFQLLNYPYIITWTVSTILLSLLFGLVLDLILVNKKPDNVRFQKYKNEIYKIFQYRKVAFTIFTVSILFVIVVPVTTQGYYGSNGIHTSYIPNDYENLSGYLTKLNNNSYYGVGFLNPSNYIFYNNLSEFPLTNPLMYDIPVRTPAIPGYISEPLPSYNFFNWAYYEFYSNSTHYFPEIMASVGYKYMVNLYNTNSADFYPNYMTKLTLNVNSSSLLEKQMNIMEIRNAKNYSVYSYSDNFSLIGEVKSYTIFAGNYNLINAMASDGVNILNFTPLFLSDTLNYNLSNILNNTSSIVEFNNNGLENLILMHSPNYSSIFKLNNKSDGWENSFSQLTNWYVNEVAQPSQFLEANCNSSISIPINNYDYGNKLWLKVLESDIQGNSIQIKAGNMTLDKISTYNSSLNSNTTGFQWINVTIPRSLSVNKLSVNVIGNYNGLEAFSFEPKLWYPHELKFIHKIISARNISIVDFANMSSYSVKELYAAHSKLNGLISLNSTIKPNLIGLSLSGVKNANHIFLRVPYQKFASSNQYKFLKPAFNSLGTTLTVLKSGGSVEILVYDLNPIIISYTISLSTVIIFPYVIRVIYKRRR